jgi:putative oxidoreductase
MTDRQLRRIAVFMSVMFLPTAIFKLTNFVLAVEFFTKWGLPLWMMHFIGAAELAGAIGLLVPRTRSAAAFALCLLMIGGLVTHLSHGEWLFATMPVLYGAGLCLLIKDSLPTLFRHNAARATA